LAAPSQGSLWLLNVRFQDVDWGSTTRHLSLDVEFGAFGDVLPNDLRQTLLGHDAVTLGPLLHSSLRSLNLSLVARLKFATGVPLSCSGSSLGTLARIFNWSYMAMVCLFQPVAYLRPNTEYLLQRQPALA